MGSNVPQPEDNCCEHPPYERVASGRKRHIVIACFGWDGGRSAGSFRAVKFARYLAKRNTHVTLLTPCPGQAATLPEGEVQSSRAVVRVPLPRGFTSPHLLARLHYRFVYYPEPQRAWVRPALRALQQIQEQRPIDAALVTTPPHSLQLLGIRAVSKMELTYVADFRDDWITNHRLRWHTPLHRRSAATWEARTVASADVVTLNTNIVADRFRRRYPDWAGKFHVLTNGYDEHDFAGPTPPLAVPADKKLIMYAGGGYGAFMLDTLSRLAQGLKEQNLDRRWHLVTAGPDESWPPSEHADVWTHLGWLPNEKLCPVLTQASLLLLAMPPGEKTPSGTVPLKTYNYLRAGGPILYLGERGATTDILKQFPDTYTEPRSMWEHAGDWVQKHEELLLPGRPRIGVDRYSIASLTGQLMTILEAALDQK